MRLLMRKNKMNKITISRLLKQNYNLSNIKEIRELKSGQGKVFEIITEKEEYILKLYNLKNSVVDLLKIKETIRLFLFLKKKEFSYEFPFPLTTTKGDYILKLESYSRLLYKRIKGDNPEELNISLIGKIARLQAEFHKTTDDFKINKKIIHFHKFVKSYKDFKRYYELKKPENKKNKEFFLSNLEFMKRCTDFAYQKLSQDSSKGVIHSDLNQYNIIIFKNKVNGLIDFENYNYSPRIFDIAYTIKMTCFKDNKLNLAKVKAYLKSYSRIYDLPKNYMRDLLPAILFDNCIYFLRAYKKGKTKELKETVATSKEIYNILNSQAKLNRIVTILKK